MIVAYGDGYRWIEWFWDFGGHTGWRFRKCWYPVKDFIEPVDDEQ